MKRGLPEEFDWHSEAACAQMGHEAFFGDVEQDRSMSPRMVKRAGMICAECPVFKDCLRSALVFEEQYGVWAGTSGRVRMRIQRMIAEKVVTIDEVVEDYCNGRRSRYEGQDEKRGIDDELSRRRSLRSA